MEFKDRAITDLEVQELLHEAAMVFYGHVAATTAGKTTMQAARKMLGTLSAAMVVIVDEEGEG